MAGASGPAPKSRTMTVPRSGNSTNLAGGRTGVKTSSSEWLLPAAAGISELIDTEHRHGERAVGRLVGDGCTGLGAVERLAEG